MVLDEMANNTTLATHQEAFHICLVDMDTLMNRDEGITCWTAIFSHAHVWLGLVWLGLARLDWFPDSD